MGEQSRFDDLTEIYEAMIDWNKRLANEEPFYRKLFEAADARRVLDASCGAGRHAALFHSWGLQVEAADLSPAMLARARERFGEPDGLRWVERGFDATPASGDFDLVICVGNSLPLLDDLKAVEQAVAALLGALRPGGMLVIHCPNLWRLPDGPCIWQKCLKTRVQDEEVTIIKGIHRAGERGFVELLVVDAESKLAVARSVAFLGLEAQALEQALRAHGAGAIGFFGGYHGQGYARESSEDLIVLASRQ